MKSLHLRQILVLFSFTLLLAAAGCGSDNNPTAPTGGGGGGGGGGDPIKTPKTFTVTKVSVSAFGGKGSGGDGVWDASLTVSKRRPDLYVALHSNSRDNAPVYTSDVRDDAFSGAPYNFTESSAGTGLPKTFPATTKVVVALMDDDGLSADDYMGGGTLDPLLLYKNDNATSYYGVFFGSNGSKFTVSARWGY